LYVRACGEELWLVSNPLGEGSIVVCDTQALSLLNLFDTPGELARAGQLFPHWVQEDVEQFVALFYKLGFLVGVGERTHAHPFTASAAEELTAWLHVTNACNLRCHYCYLVKTQDDLSIEVGRKAVDALFRVAVKHKMKRIKIKYAGGEASLQIGNVLALHEYSTQLALRHDIELKTVLLSNGVVLSQRTIDQLKARNIAVAISLDGLGSYHDQQRPFRQGQASSRYVTRTIERLLANGLIPHISITISQRNLEGLPDLINFILAHRLPFSFNYYRENRHSAHIADLQFIDEDIIRAMRSVFLILEKNLPARSLLNCLLDKAKLAAPHQHTCGVGQNYLVIDQKGGVAKCQMEIEQTVTTVEVEDPLEELRNDREGVAGLSVDEKEGCRECTWRYWCTGGCPTVTYRATGRYDVKSPNCAIYQELLPDVLRLEALRLLHYEMPLTARQSNLRAS